MINWKRQRGWKEILQSKPVLMILGVVILLFIWSIFGFFGKMEQTAKNKQLMQDKVAALEQQKTKLSSDIQSLQTDQGKEKVFRENFGLAKEGEDMIVIVDDKSQPAAPAGANSSGFFGFLKSWFK